MRFSYTDADNYSTTGKSSFFTLKDDGDTARVRFMYAGVNDISGESVHEITLNDKKRYVACPREYSDPIDACPFCSNPKTSKLFSKVFVPLFNEDTGEAQVWERGPKFFGQLADIVSHYENPVSQVFEIKRHGKPRDTQTNYTIFPVGAPDSTTLDDLPEAVDIYKGIVLKKSVDEMNYFNRYGEFPEVAQNDSADTPPWNNTPARQSAPAQPVRRTPANNAPSREF